MKTGAIIAAVVGAVVVLFFAISKGLIGSGVSIGPGGKQTGIIAPQPAQNYGGYLAATTAPAVSGIVNTLLTGVNGATHSWLAPSGPTPAQAPVQSASPSSPSLSAQPSGPTPVNAFYADSFAGNATPIGPVVDPVTSYSATAGSAFDFAGLSADNSWDSGASLEV